MSGCLFRPAIIYFGRIAIFHVFFAKLQVSQMIMAQVPIVILLKQSSSPSVYVMQNLTSFVHKPIFLVQGPWRISCNIVPSSCFFNDLVFNNSILIQCD